MATPRRRNAGHRSRHPHNSYDPRGDEFLAPGPEHEERRPRARDGRRVPVSAASELLWVFLVGAGDAGRAGERGVFGRVRGGAVEVFSEED